MTDTTQPHPEPSEEASSLPVVGYAIRESDQFMWAPPVSRPFAKAWRAVVYEADAQSKLNAMRVERDAAREHLARSEGLLAIAIKQNENADRRALKAAPVVDVEAILRLAEKMMRDSWATGDDSAWHPARDELRAALASPEGSPR